MKIVKGNPFNKKLSGHKASEKESYIFHQAVLSSKKELSFAASFLPDCVPFSQMIREGRAFKIHFPFCRNF